MQLENLGGLTKLLFARLLDRYRLETVNARGILQALRAVYPTPELHRLFYVLGKVPAEGRRPIDEEILRDYRNEAVERLQEDHVFLARAKELQVIRRPRIFDQMVCLGKMWLAISERRLVTGEDGRLVVQELAAFPYLPRPARACSVGQAAEAWGVPVAAIDAFLETHFYQAPQREQVDVFGDHQLNLLRYNRRGEFIDALPAAPGVPTLRLLKGRVGRGPGAEENPVGGSLSGDPDHALSA